MSSEMWHWVKIDLRDPGRVYGTLWLRDDRLKLSVAYRPIADDPSDKAQRYRAWIEDAAKGRPEINKAFLDGSSSDDLIYLFDIALSDARVVWSNVVPWAFSVAENGREWRLSLHSEWVPF